MGIRSRRGPRPKQDWQEHLRRAQKRGITLVQYCRERNLSVQSLYTARYELSKQLRGSSAARTVSGAAGKFVQVQIAPSEPARSSMAYRVCVKDCVIECATLPPTSWLRSLISGDTNAVS